MGLQNNSEHTAISHQEHLKTSSMKSAIISLISSSPQTFNRCYHSRHLLRLGLLPAISAGVPFSALFMSKGSSQQNCNLPILLRLCKSGSTMIMRCITFSSAAQSEGTIHEVHSNSNKNTCNTDFSGVFNFQKYANMAQKSILS